MTKIIGLLSTLTKNYQVRGGDEGWGWGGGGGRGVGGRRGGEGMWLQLPGIYTVNSIQTLNCAFLRQDASLLPLILQPPTLYSSLTAPPTSPVPLYPTHKHTTMWLDRVARPLPTSPPSPTPQTSCTSSPMDRYWHGQWEYCNDSISNIGGLDTSLIPTTTECSVGVCSEHKH